MVLTPTPFERYVDAVKRSILIGGGAGRGQAPSCHPVSGQYFLLIPSLVANQGSKVSIDGAVLQFRNALREGASPLPVPPP